jgi:hypothetical protein
MLYLRSSMDHNTAGEASFVSVAVSGATTLAASDDYALGFTKATNGAMISSLSFILGGLTAGTNTFTINYRTGSGTFTSVRRGLTAHGIA